MGLDNINLIGSIAGAVAAMAIERRPWRLMAIYLGYLLISMLVMAAVITFLGG